MNQRFSSLQEFFPVQHDHMPAGIAAHFDIRSCSGHRPFNSPAGMRTASCDNIPDSDYFGHKTSPCLLFPEV